MGKIADKILALSKKHLEDKDRRGETVKDFRNSKHLDQYIDNAERAGVVSALKGGAPSDDSPTYQDGIQAFMGSVEFGEYLQVRGGTSKTFSFDPSRTRGQVGAKAPSLTTISDIRANLTTERVGDPIRLGVRQTRLREYFAQIPMSGSAVTTMRETGFTNSASGRPENVDPANQTPAG